MFTILFLAFLCVTLVMPNWPVIHSNAQVIQAWASFHHINPYTSYVEFGLRLVMWTATLSFGWFFRLRILGEFPRIIVGVGWIGAVLKPRFAPLVSSSRTTAPSMVLFRMTNLAYGGLAFALIVFMYVNTDMNSFRPGMVAPFHEGEWLGVAPVMAKTPHPLTFLFLAHGIGVDILPTAISHLIFAPDQTIYGARFARLIILLVGFIPGLWLILGEIAKAHGIHQVGRARLIMVCGLAALHWHLWSIGYYPPVDMPLRRVFFLIQIVLSLILMRATTWTGRHICAVVLGLTVVPALVWNMGDGSYGAALFLCALGMIAIGHGRAAIVTILGAALGLMTAWVGCAVAFPGYLTHMVTEMAYWSLYGREIALNHLPQLSILGTVLYQKIPITMVFLMAAAIVVLLDSLRRVGLRRTILDQACLIVLLAAATVFIRVPLEDGSKEYWGIAGLFTCFILFDFSASLSVRYLGSLKPWFGTVATGATCVALYMTTSPYVFGFKNAEYNVQGFVRYVGAKDSVAYGSALGKALDAARPLFKGQACTVDIDMNAFWLYALDMPSCTPYYNSVFASAPPAQKLYIADMKKAAPRYIVYKGPFTEYYPHTSVARRLPMIYAYVDRAYEPFSDNDGLMIWRLKADATMAPQHHAAVP